MITHILFDFDGVLMDSMPIKLEAYKYALDEYNFDKNELKRIQNTNAGLSRGKVLKIMYEELLHSSITEELLDSFLEKFEEFDLKNIERIPRINESIEFLESIHKIYYTAIVTGTPQSAIEKTVDIHNLNHYFDDVFGSPRSKSEIINSIIECQNLSKDNCIFIGDGLVDQKAANECGVKFVGLARGNESFNHEDVDLVVNDLRELLPYLKELSDSTHHIIDSNKNVDYIKAKEEDFKDLVNLRVRAMKPSLEKIGRFSIERATNRFRNSFIPNCTTIIRCNRRIIGFYMVSIESDTLHLNHLYIDPEYQGHGYGKDIIERVKKLSITQNINIKLEALKESRSNEFYTKHGFKLLESSQFDNVYIWEPIGIK